MDGESHVMIEPLSHHSLPNPAGNLLFPYLIPDYHHNLGNVTPEQLYALLYYNFNNNQSDDVSMSNNRTVVVEEVKIGEVEQHQEKSVEEPKQAIQQPQDTVQVSEKIEESKEAIDTPQDISEVSEKTIEESKGAVEKPKDATEVSEKTIEESKVAIETLQDTSEVSEKMVEELQTTIEEPLEKTAENPQETKEQLSTNIYTKLLTENMAEKQTRASPCRMLREILDVDDTQSVRSGRYKKKQAPVPPTDSHRLSTNSIDSLSSKSTEYEDVDDSITTVKNKQKKSMFNLSKLPFSFFTGRQVKQEKNNSGQLSRNSSYHSVKTEAEDVIYIPLRDDTTSSHN
jgi:hypothetical protein